MSQKFKAADKITQKMSKDGLVERNIATGEDTVISKRQADIDLRSTKPERGSHSQPLDTPNRKRGYRYNKTDPATNVKTGINYQPSIIAPVTQESNTAIDVAKSVTPLTAENAAPVVQEVNAAIDVAKSVAPLLAENAVPVKQAGHHGSLQSATKRAFRKRIRKTLSKNYKTGTSSQNNLPKTDKSARLQFTTDEAVPAKAAKMQKTADRKLIRAESKVERSAVKLSKAQDKLPTKRKIAKSLLADDRSGLGSGRLQFEKSAVSQKSHMKGALALRPVKYVAGFTIGKAHQALSQHENDNVGLKATHRVEMVAESGVRSTLRFRKTAPYRKVHKLERATVKKRISFDYRRSVAKNPKLQRNPFLRALQKRKIKKDYAKAAREAHKAAKRAKRAGSIVNRVGKVIISLVRRHPVVAIVIILLGLVLLVLMSLFSTASSIGGGTVSGVVFTTYLASDEDMLGAEAVYAGMEADLQDMLDNYEQLNPGYDEYQYELDDIKHDPYVLMSILSALHDGEWTLNEVQGTLGMLFDLQYILTETVTVEIRTRTETETVIDPETLEEVEIEVTVEYEYRIITVTLENFNLSHLPVYIMGVDRLSRYALLMRTLGNRPDLFPTSQYPHASYYQEYGKHTIPPEYFGDAKFAEIIAEAEKYLGWPYVWGGSSPATSFDCSGFVSWVLNQTGWNFGRLGARGLYNICTPISPEQAKPGDLIFFNYTYNAPQPHLPTHVGIYVGDGMMLHCGNPIGYASINTPYWQKHFYGFGRP